MSERTRTITQTVTTLYCDVLVEGRRCEKRAEGFCIFCGKELCTEHGEGQQTLGAAGHTVMICAEDAAAKSISALRARTADRTLVKQLWDDFYSRRRDIEGRADSAREISNREVDDQD